MWLMSYITGNSLKPARASKGNVDISENDGMGVTSSGEYKKLRCCLPYGIVSRAPSGSNAVVLPLEDAEVVLGAVTSVSEIEEGELKLFSKGGASIILKNDGTVLINGKEYGND